MAKSIVLSALHNKYRRIKGELAALDNQCEKLRGQLMHLEQTITLFAADWTGDSVAAKRPYRPSRWAKRGQGLQTALTVLREAASPMSAREIMIEVTRRLDMPLPQPQTLAGALRTALLARAGFDFRRFSTLRRRNWSARVSPGQ